MREGSAVVTVLGIIAGRVVALFFFKKKFWQDGLVMFSISIVKCTHTTPADLFPSLPTEPGNLGRSITLDRRTFL